MRVRIDAKLLRSFVGRAKRRFPLEYIESLFGTSNHDGFCVQALEEIEHDAEKDAVFFEGEDVPPLEKRGRLFRLGTIHSHPNDIDSSPSEYDWAAQRDRAEAVSGICCVYKDKKGCLRSRTRFYLANALLDIERT